jgi:FAD synthase
MEAERLYSLFEQFQGKTVQVTYWLRKSQIADKNGRMHKRIGIFAGIHHSHPSIVLKSKHSQLRIYAGRIVKMKPYQPKFRPLNTYSPRWIATLRNRILKTGQK